VNLSSITEVWQEWLSDEEKLAYTPQQRLQVTLLYQRAVKDYLGINSLFSFSFFLSLRLHNKNKNQKNIKKTSL
jgi:hypothetical protein